MAKNYYPLFIICFLFTTLISAQNTSPFATVDYDTADINTPVNVAAPGVLGNDTDADGDMLTVVEFTINSIPYLAGQTGNLNQGSIIINTDGSYIFTPNNNYTGDVDIITYTITDGASFDTAHLLFTVEEVTNLLEFNSFTSCNQGYTVDGDYKIIYSASISNTSNAKDYHASSLITNIDLTNNLDAIYGNSCVTSIEVLEISTSDVEDFINDRYPTQFTSDAINPDFLDGNSSSLFNNNAINNFTLYPRQTINIAFCVTIDAFCGGRTNPTVSGSGVDFNSVLNITSSTNTTSESLLLTDFHSSEAIVTAALHVPVREPEVNPNGTFDYINTIIITNEGTATATNINYNMGLGNFIDNGISYSQLTVSQVSGPTVTTNSNYDGNNETNLLATNNSLAAGATIILEVFALTDPLATLGTYNFSQMSRSQTQGGLDGFDETAIGNEKEFSFVTWSDASGNHLDRYYPATSATSAASSTSQCSCNTTAMRFFFTSNSSITKETTAIVTEPNDILEHQEITYQTTIRNNSPAIQLENLQIIDDLDAICGGNIISVTRPSITASTATTLPSINLSYNGDSQTNIFNGTTGVLEPNQFITIEYTVLFSEDCDGTSTVDFSAKDPAGRNINSSFSIAVDATTDTDGDGIPNSIDIDDDNDTILDTDEYNGLNPLDDHDGDSTPNYRDTNFSTDANNDGIVDLFDFDNDGVPNHFDLDSDNDGIFDLIEVNNAATSNDNDGIASTSNVGDNGLHNDVETSDSTSATSIIAPPNTDNNGNPNFIDIDADDDGIVDNIEAQTTFNYISLSGTINQTFGTDDTSYPNGITPVDSDNDGIPDYVDINSDNDIRFDVLEAWDTNSDGTAETVIANADADNDGLDDAFDTNDSTINPTNSQTPINFPDVDNTDNPERDWREIMAIVILIDNVSTIENENGNLIFTLSFVTKNDNTIPVQSASDITINFTTTDGTENTSEFNIAIAPFDYNSPSNASFTITTNEMAPSGIAATPETITYGVTTLEDNIYELEELLTLTGNVTSNNTFTTEFSGIGTINDNDDKPIISINDAEENEGIDLEHTIMLSHPSSTPVIINITTIDDQAISPEDYTAINEVITIAGTVDPTNPNLEALFVIETFTDNTNELEKEQLLIESTITTNNTSIPNLTNTATIIDLDPQPMVVIEDVTAVEGNDFVFTYSLLNPITNEPMLNYQPFNLLIETVNESATETEDYSEIITSIILPALTFSTTQIVTTVDDNLNEDTETFILKTELRSTDDSNQPNNPNEVIFLEVTGFIKDNDIPNLFSPNNDRFSDVFEIAGLEEDYPDFKLIIFDRWGSEIYNYSNQGNLFPEWWDGTYNGTPSPAGVYFYNLDFNDGTTLPKKNFIELIR